MTAPEPLAGRDASELATIFSRLTDADRSLLLHAARSLRAHGDEIRKAYSRYLIAAHDTGDIGAQQRAILDCLRQSPLLHSEIAERLASAFEELIAGFPPVAGMPSEVLLPIPRQGVGRRPLHSRLLALAVRYLQAADSGLIADNAPVLAVANAFGVTRRQVGRWRKEWGDTALPPFMPHLEQDLCDREAGLARAKAIARAMLAAGAVYRRLYPRDKLHW